MVLLEGIELSTSPLPKHCFRLRLLKLLAFPLLESRRVTICSGVFGASGTGNSTGDPVSHTAGQLPELNRLVAAVPEVSLDNLSDRMLQACYRLSGTALPIWPALRDE
jgi:hypothetical protein